MNSYVKVLLYTYPRMAAMEKDFEEHIQNKACASVRYYLQTEQFAECLAGEVIKCKVLRELKDKLDRAMERLSAKEKLLLEMRYFRRKRVLRFVPEDVKKSIGSKRSYYRAQARLIRKMEGLFALVGITRETFFERYADLDGVKEVLVYIQNGKEKNALASEQALFNLIACGKETLPAGAASALNLQKQPIRLRTTAFSTAEG